MTCILACKHATALRLFGLVLTWHCHKPAPNMQKKAKEGKGKPQ